MKNLKRFWSYLSGKRSAFNIHGGRDLETHKNPARQPSREALLVPNYYLNLLGRDGQAQQLLVAVGDYVYKNQALTQAISNNEVPIHAPTSGVITALEAYPSLHPSGQLTPHLVITADGKDEALPALASLDYKNTDKSALLARIRDCGIVGLGGAGFPTARKLQGQARTLVVNVVECEPYITCDEVQIQEHAPEIIIGAEIASKIINADRIVFAIENDKPEAIDALKSALLAHGAQNISLQIVPARYPSGNSRQLFELLFNLRIPAQEHASSHGLICHNSGTLKAVYDAVILGIPLVERYCTLSGEALLYPSVLRIRFGTPLSALIAQCGGLKAQRKIIIGGPMMGFEQEDLRAAANKITNAILALPPAKIVEEENCIRCGQCADTCPMELLPQQLYWYSRAEEREKLIQYRLFDCIECGLCASVCPSHIPLVQYYRFSKANVTAEKQKEQQNQKAKQRFEARNERLQREAEEREAKMQARSMALQNKTSEALPEIKLAKPEVELTPSFNPTLTENNDDKKAAIAAAQARAAARKSERLNKNNSATAEADKNHHEEALSKPQKLENNEQNQEINDKLAAAKAKAAARKAERLNKNNSATAETNKNHHEEALSKPQKLENNEQNQEINDKLAAAKAKAAARKAERLKQAKNDDNSGS